MDRESQGEEGRYYHTPPPRTDARLTWTEGTGWKRVWDRCGRGEWDRGEGVRSGSGGGSLDLKNKIRDSHPVIDWRWFSGTSLDGLTEELARASVRLPTPCAERGKNRPSIIVKWHRVGVAGLGPLMGEDQFGRCCGPQLERKTRTKPNLRFFTHASALEDRRTQNAFCADVL